LFSFKRDYFFLAHLFCYSLQFFVLTVGCFTPHQSHV
jgi:hypothetical protein